MKKFISGSFVTLSLLCTLGLRCSATKLPSIPENLKNIILKHVQNDTERKIINDQILNFLKSMPTKEERIEAFWELAKIISEPDCWDLIKATKLNYNDFRKYIENNGNYDIYYSEKKGTICAIGPLSPFMISRPYFMLTVYDGDSSFNYTLERFFSVSNKDISTPLVIDSLIK